MNDAATIAKAFGLARAGRSYTGRCPCCGYPSGFVAEDGKGAVLIRCHAGGCSQADVIAALRAQGLWAGERDPNWTPPTQRDRADQGERAEAMRRASLDIWRKTVPPAGTHAQTYLRSRSIDLLPPTLRYAPALRHRPTGLYFPAMVGAVARWPDRTPCGIHRTYLRPDGSGKANVASAKMTLGPIAGGAVRLAPAGPVLIVGEGIETTLSAMLATGLPGWAALSAGGIAALVLPEEVRELIVAADNDSNGVGQRAAETAAARWCAEGRKVRIALPPTAGTDFNDMLRAELALEAACA